MGTAITRVTAEPGTPFIEITRDFAAPVELLFRVHTEPDLLAQWLGPRKYTMIVERYEVRDGGVYRYVHRGADGVEHGFRGVFHGTPSLGGITQTFEYEGWPGHVSLETLHFDPIEGGTRLHIRSVYQSVEDRDGMVSSGMEDGVREGYERLDELVAGLAAPTH